MEDLFFFTDRYPFNTSEAFIENEIDIMAGNFNRVFVLPCGVMVNTATCRAVPDNVVILTPPVSDDIYKEKPSRLKKILWAFRHLIPWFFLCFFTSAFYKELYFLIMKVGFTPARFIRVLRTLAPALRNKCHYLRLLRSYNIKNAIAYSYWLEPTILYSDDIIGKGKISRKISRTHRWDLYEEESPINYLAFQKQIIAYIDDLFIISDNGRKYLTEKYPEFRNKFKISRLGTKDLGLNAKSNDSVFRIVSCSNIIPLKRVDMILDSLSLLDEEYKNIEWVHFGGGQYFEHISNLAHDKLKNINYVLTGQVSNAKILDFYRNNHVDLFIHVSSSEGIPVSIMEAISFGIPVVATNVGGTNEIVVDGEDGFLLGKDFELKELSSLISYLIDNPIKLENLRHGARNLWSSLYSCSSNYLSFYNSILK